MMQRSVAILAVLAVANYCSPQKLHAAQFDQLIVFGDSLSDTGNVFQLSEGTFPPSTPPGLLYDGGRLTNGPVWVEYLANAVGAPAPLPSLLGGTNFAWGGAQSTVSFELYDSTLDPDPFPISSTFSIVDQVDGFLADLATGGEMPDPDTTLYVLWGGANDFLIGNAHISTRVARNIEFSIHELIRTAGAEHLLVPNMPTLVDTPGVAGGFDSAFVAEEQPSKLGTRVEKFNTKLSKSLDKIARKNADVKIYEFDVFSLYQAILSDPQGNGFNLNTDVPVISEAVLYGTKPGPLFLNDPVSSLFFDGVHPTTLGHRRLAEEAAKLLASTTEMFLSPAVMTSVPEPSAILMICAGSFILLGRRPRSSGVDAVDS